MSRIWILRLVPPGKYGRWLYAITSFSVVFGLLAMASGKVGYGGFSWPIGLFFCFAIAYVVPVFHFVTQRTEEALDELRPSLGVGEAQYSQLRNSITHKTWRWLVMNASISVLFWFGQSWAMAPDGAAIMSVFSGEPAAVFLAVVPLLVWLTMMCSLHALVDNARMCRHLAEKTSIDLLDATKLAPFGRMAVSSTLVVIGSMASFSIMWLGGDVNPFTTIPPLVPTTAGIVYLLIAPLWPVHQALKAAKRAELDRIQAQIRQTAESMADSVEAQAQRLAPLLAYRREIGSISDWPLDFGVLTRLGLYLVIVPLTWIGAALIENVVDVFIA